MSLIFFVVQLLFLLACLFVSYYSNVSGFLSLLVIIFFFFVNYSELKIVGSDFPAADRRPAARGFGVRVRSSLRGARTRTYTRQRPK